MAKNGSVDRRDFLKSAAVTGAALVGGAAGAEAQTAPPHLLPQRPQARPSRRGKQTLARSRHRHDRSPRRRLHGRRAEGAQLRVSSRPIRARASAASTSRSSTTATTRRRSSSPAATRNRPSRWRTATSKVEGKPMAVLVHGTVGLQHASMAIYNAYCDRVPIIRAGGQLARRDDEAAGRRMGAQRAGRRGDGARLHQVGRPADARCRTSRNRRCAPTRSR